MGAARKKTAKKAARINTRKGVAKRRPRPTAKSLANLKPAKKGEVRNPRGISGWTKLQDAIEKELGEAAPDIAAVVQRLCRSGNVQMIKHVTQGAAQRVELSGPDGEAVQFRWVDGND